MKMRLIAITLNLFLLPLGAQAQSQRDDHGFPLPKGAIARLGDLHFAHPTTITAMALTLDGKTIATAGADICLWDAVKGLIVRKISIPHSITTLVFSKDGTLLAAASQDGAIAIWDSTSGKKLWQAKGRKDGWQGDISGLRFIANDSLLAVARTDTETLVIPAQINRQVQLWDVATGNLKQSWQCGSGIIDVALSPSGELMAWLASSKSDKGEKCRVLIYATATGQGVREVKGVYAPGDKIGLLDEGQHLLVKVTGFLLGSEERDEKGNTVLTSLGNHAVINVKDNRVQSRFDYRLAYFISRPFGERLYVKVLALAPDGKSLYLQDEVGMVHRELLTGKVLQEWREHCSSLAFFPDNKRALIACGSRLLVCDEKLNPLQQETEHFNSPIIHFLWDGKLVALARYRGRLNVWDTQKRRIVETMVRFDAPQVGRTPCSYDSWEKLFAHHDDNGIVVHDLLTNRQISRLKGITTKNDCWSIRPSLSGDGKRVLVSSTEKDGILARWFDTKTGNEIGRHHIGDKAMLLKWYSSDGSLFGYVTADGRLALSNCSKERLPVLVGIPEWVLAKDVDDSSRWPAWDYASAGFDRFVAASRRRGSLPGSREYVILNKDNGQRLRRFILRPPPILKKNPDADLHWRATLSPDGRIMAVLLFGNEVRCYDTATGLLRGSIRTPNQITMLDFSPDSQTLATSCSDTSILLWDIHLSLNHDPELAPPGTIADAEKLWQILDDPDPAVMAPALWSLKRAPELALALLKRNLRPVRGPEPGQIMTLISGLDSADFKKRQAASRELMALAEYAVGPLYAVLEKPISPEQQRRVQGLLIQLDSEPLAPKFLRELRSLELLEYLGTSEARAMVANLATGHDDALITREAKLVLERWKGKD